MDCEAFEMITSTGESLEVAVRLVLGEVGSDVLVDFAADAVLGILLSELRVATSSLTSGMD